MTDHLFETVLVPIASETDAERTCEALLTEVGDERVTVHAVHVIEKAGGAPDKASVEQREERAERVFEIVEERLGDADVDIAVTTEIVYGTDVAEAILDRASELGATAIAFTPREASRWMKLLSGDVARRLMADSEFPLVVLPGGGGDE